MGSNDLSKAKSPLVLGPVAVASFFPCMGMGDDFRMKLFHPQISRH